ncbi:MAG: LysR family transcriptional regulator [Rhodobacteraceae bacterium GWE1_64_9]|nr:MAG: LysR family transcriptional regulator [Rhodobacteraceae bacterium GWE1_64_9]HBU13857.1 LysR family transcriptional regulator [Gemmobacter sp.]
MKYSLRQMQIFDEVARSLSYTRAAETLNLTQPAVFAQVKQLEDQVGTALIERLGRKLYLTEAGAAVQEAATEVLAEIARMEMRLADLGGLARGRLRIAAVSTAEYTVPARIGAFTAAHPGIEVELTVGNRQELLERFARNADDLYILGTPPEGLEAVTEVYAENPLVLVAPPGHALASEPQIAAARVAALPFLMREQGSGTRIATERFFAERGLNVAARMELGSNEAIKQGVMAGLGLAVLSRSTLEMELRHGALLLLDVQGFPLPRHWHVAYPAGKRLSVAAKAFLAALRQPSLVGTGAQRG